MGIGMNYASKDQLIAFTDRIRAHWRAGRLPCNLHLCGGNEDQLVEIFREVNEGDWILSSHRNHYHALLAGIPAGDLEQWILNGWSMFTFSRDHNFLSSSVLAGTCGIAAGIAWALKQEGSAAKVVCFVGDGAEEEGAFYEAVMFVEANELPCRFIIEDNDYQVDTPKTARRGMSASTRYPLDHFSCVKRYHYARTYPHQGDGSPPGTFTFDGAAVQRMREHAL